MVVANTASLLGIAELLTTVVNGYSSEPKTNNLRLLQFEKQFVGIVLTLFNSATVNLVQP